jgi:hypothetical protein
MPETTFRTIRLTAGRHHAPQDGACAMELASMLAGEPFSDAPKAVCPVVGAFVRGYNDHLPCHERQDLYGLIADLVGTGHGDAFLMRDRANRCMGWVRRLRRELAWRAVRAPRFSYTDPIADAEAAGGWAALFATRHPYAHPRTLGFLRELAGIGPAVTFPEDPSAAARAAALVS